ncbi:MAG: KpsF/GutQ family sugar-phosphate isomerase [Pseudomonadota bacterium]
MRMHDPLVTARDVIALEAAGLEALRNALGPSFSQALDLLQTSEGRVIVTGVGKSGLVARKIAATFSSTGTPALFIHAADASHGDLGAIAATDIILALSKSGETGELGDLLAYAARFSIPLIAISGNSDSTLARSAQVAIGLPPAKEACDETHAPTTSTTMMMALGDALAVALLRARGFTSDDFKGFHPGGNLGAALRRASDLMHGPDRLPLATLSTKMPKAIETMTSAGFGCVGVTDASGTLAGIITDGDLRRHYDVDLTQKTAGDIMTTNPRVTSSSALAGDVLAIMSREKITALFVVEDARPIGIVHVHDCLSIGVL